jgi:hypothetical protein
MQITIYLKISISFFPVHLNVNRCEYLIYFLLGDCFWEQII